MAVAAEDADALEAEFEKEDAFVKESDLSLNTGRCLFSFNRRRSMKEWYRRLPKMDLCLEDERAKKWIDEFGYEAVKAGFSQELAAIRKQIPGLEDEAAFQFLINSFFNGVENRLRSQNKGLVPVVNATGTLLHTNLGRANLRPDLAKRAVEKASRYSNLEYRLEIGKRGSRYDHIEGLLCDLTGAEAAMAVNNNAAAVMLMLAALAESKEVVVSRGELVEIGGSFRIPEVMRLSGARLREVGTTNRTRVSDYAEATVENTGAYLKVHTSNYPDYGVYRICFRPGIGGFESINRGTGFWRIREAASCGLDGLRTSSGSNGASFHCSRCRCCYF